MGETLWFLSGARGRRYCRVSYTRPLRSSGRDTRCLCPGSAWKTPDRRQRRPCSNARAGTAREKWPGNERLVHPLFHTLKLTSHGRALHASGITSSGCAFFPLWILNDLRVTSHGSLRCPPFLCNRALLLRSVWWKEVATLFKLVACMPCFSWEILFIISSDTSRRYYSEQV